MKVKLWRVVARMASYLIPSLIPVVIVLAPGCAQGWHDPSKHNVQFITVEDGVRLEVLDWGGSGRPIVLLAGLGTTAHVFDGFAEKLAQSHHVYGITRRGYGASSRPPSGYSEQRRAEDDLRVIDALKLVKPVMAGHSISGDELSQLGIYHYDRIGGLVYLEALNDATDDYTEYIALCHKPPKAMQNAPSPSASDLKSFQAYRDWRASSGQVAIPESELRNEFAENRDGSVGEYKVPGDVPAAMTKGRERHDYSQIRAPVLALVGFPKTPDAQMKENHVTDEGERTIVAAVYGMYVGMTRHRIDRINRAAGGARVVELWGADHYVFLSNPEDVLREMRVFLASLQ
ncbi:MAG TPA: alpha/beta hydrolase [Terriglobales bacterium]|nr:alpha/beta hydrolase [Terriglobales bacterium]